MSEHFPLPLRQHLHNTSLQVRPGVVVKENHAFSKKISSSSSQGWTEFLAEDPLVVVTVHSGTMGNRPIENDSAAIEERHVKNLQSTLAALRLHRTSFFRKSPLSCLALEFQLPRMSPRRLLQRSDSGRKDFVKIIRDAVGTPTFCSPFALRSEHGEPISSKVSSSPSSR